MNIFTKKQIELIKMINKLMNELDDLYTEFKESFKTN